MSITERQIVAGLDQLHREFGVREPCRFQYDGHGGNDTYSCEHIRLTGHALIEHVNWFNHYKITQEDIA